MRTMLSNKGEGMGFSQINCKGLSSFSTQYYEGFSTEKKLRFELRQQLKNNCEETCDKGSIK